jgi:hypothetical protein
VIPVIRPSFTFVVIVQTCKVISDKSNVVEIGINGNFVP